MNKITGQTSENQHFDLILRVMFLTRMASVLTILHNSNIKNIHDTF